jgi:hypothetical protein
MKCYRRYDNTVKLTQEGLIKHIIEALEISDLPIKHTPASAEPLIKDKNRDLLMEPLIIVEW